MSVIDLRSDTVTRPTPAMRRAMAEAEVGDDVLGDDPTVKRLEALAAERLGKEAGLFVPSGTMGNLVSLLTHCRRGDEVLLGDECHSYIYEQGGSAAVGGIHPRALRTRPDGTFDLAEVEAAIRADDDHFPRTRLLALENTHNRCGGTVLPSAWLSAAGELARRHQLAVHVDGARLFNAAVALGVEPRDLLADADSASVCLSKGLAAPVGSVVVGRRDFVREARRNRKILGGGMRQAGVIAAAGIVALEQGVARLAEDHERARALAQGLAALPGLRLDPASIQTNIVYFGLDHLRLDARALAARLRERGVWLFDVGPRRLRAVTHYHIGAADVARAVAVTAEVLAAA